MTLFFLSYSYLIQTFLKHNYVLIILYYTTFSKSNKKISLKYKKNIHCKKKKNTMIYPLIRLISKNKKDIVLLLFIPSLNKKKRITLK